MSNIVHIDLSKKDQQKRNKPPEILYGLPKGKFGFLISTPDTGKSYTCLSLAYEIATGIKLLGLSTNTTPKKVLYWPMEDGEPETMERVIKHLSKFNSSSVKLVEENLKLYSMEDFICQPMDVSAYLQTSNLDTLISEGKGFDLIIVDTIREASGACDEVKDDRIIKMSLQRLAKETGAAVLVTHHLTKEASRGNEPITSISGSGLSETLANSRYQLLVQRHVKKTKDTDYSLSHIKKNYVPKDKVLNQEPLHWTEYSLPILDLSALKSIESSEDQSKDNKDKEVRNIGYRDFQVADSDNDPVGKSSGIFHSAIDLGDPPEHDYPEADSIDMDAAVISKDSQEKAVKQKKETSIIRESDIERLKSYKKKAQLKKGD
jgi:RecA-family ATPase